VSDLVHWFGTEGPKCGFGMRQIGHLSPEVQTKGILVSHHPMEVTCQACVDMMAAQTQQGRSVGRILFKVTKGREPFRQPFHGFIGSRRSTGPATSRYGRAGDRAFRAMRVLDGPPG
jgi:hypothetical protein